MREVGKDDVPDSAARLFGAGIAMVIIGIVAVVAGADLGYLCITAGIAFAAAGLRASEIALTAKRGGD